MTKHELLKDLRQKRLDAKAGRNDELDLKVDKALANLETFLAAPIVPIAWDSDSLRRLTLKGKEHPSYADLFRQVAMAHFPSGSEGRKNIPIQYYRVNPNEGILRVENAHTQAYLTMLGDRAKPSSSKYAEALPAVHPSVLACYPYLLSHSAPAPVKAAAPIARVDYTHVTGLFEQLHASCSVLAECQDPLNALKSALALAEQNDEKPVRTVTDPQPSPEPGVIQRVLEALITTLCVHFSLGNDKTAEFYLELLSRWQIEKMGIVGVNGKFLLAARFTQPNPT